GGVGRGVVGRGVGVLRGSGRAAAAQRGLFDGGQFLLGAAGPGDVGEAVVLAGAVVQLPRRLGGRRGGSGPFGRGLFGGGLGVRGFEVRGFGGRSAQRR